MGRPNASATLLLLCWAAWASAASGQTTLEQPLVPMALQGTAMVGLATDAGCGLPATPSWAGQAALSPNSSLAVQVGDRGAACAAAPTANRRCWPSHASARALVASCPSPPAPTFLRPSPQASPLSGCGTCLEVESDAGPSARVVVTGVCSSCTATQLTVDAATLAVLASGSASPLNVSYRAVECRPPPGTNVTVHVLDYRTSEGGWLRLVRAGQWGPWAMQHPHGRCRGGPLCRVQPPNASPPPARARRR